jgi:dihydropteroate synthase
MQINCNHQLLDLGIPKVMGIINLTPNSFFDGGKYQKEDAYLERAEKLVREGAAIIDMGAASTKPGSTLIDEQDEWKILQKPIKQLRKKYPEILISVDTYNATQVKKCADQGVNIINDISGGSWDEQMFTEIAKYEMAYVMMHIQGQPEIMQENPSYGNILEELKEYFKIRIEKLRTLNFDKIILDPGFGFGKTLDHNFELLAGINRLESLGYPILAGLSRKSMVFRTLDIGPNEALNGTTALNMLALINSAKILRVHDVKEAVETIELFSRYKANS